MDKEHKHHHHQGGGGFSNGFLLGVLVGGGLVFLLGTKKGKQVLKTITENGFEGVSELKDLLRDEDESIIDEYTQNGEVSQPEHENSETRPQIKSMKRFFRGIKR